MTSYTDLPDTCNNTIEVCLSLMQNQHFQVMHWKALADGRATQNEQMSQMNKELRSQIVNLQSHIASLQAQMAGERQWSRETTPTRLAILSEAPPAIEGYGDQSQLATME